MLRFVFSTLRGSRLVLIPLALVAGAVFGVFGTVAGCSSSDSDSGGKSPPADSGASFDGAGGNADAGSACAPASVQDFEPNWERPPSWYRGACTAEELDTFQEQCESTEAAKYFSPGCADFRKSAEHEKCNACIFDPVTAKEQPALIATSLDHRVANRAACIANATNDFSASGCAAKYQALVQCQIKACTANCPLSALGDGDFRDCSDRAAVGPCNVYNGKVEECAGLDAGAAVRACVKDPEPYIVRVLCGKRPNDGG